MTWLTHPSEYVAAPLKTIDNRRPNILSEIEHSIDLPVLCPHSRNPLAGSTLSIRYTARERILELFALEAYIQAFVGHPQVRDMEFFVQVVGEECARILGVPVACVGQILYNGLGMGQTIRVQVATG
ncbi:MAG: hypothetical protein H6R05_1428 [Burkholderiaceae bacterium]|nr:hypothetical protein [Burkholderiaceae bacterium]